MSTTDYFSQNKDTFDLIFIDADHTHEQSLIDLEQSLLILNEGGAIVMHDGNPRDKFHESPAACGTVWKTIVLAKSNPNLDVIVCDFDHGTSVIRKATNKNALDVSDVASLTYEDLATNRESWLNVQDYSKFLKWVENW